MKGIHVSTPRPYQEVGDRFIISGSVPISWLKLGFGGYDDRVYLDLIDIDGQTFVGDTLFVSPVNWIAKLFRLAVFRREYQFSNLSTGFLSRSQGRVTIKIYGRNEREQFIYIPLRIPYFEPEGGVVAAIIERQANIPETLEWYKRELEEYNREMAVIYKSRKAKDLQDGATDSLAYFGGKGLEVAYEIAKILDEADENFDDYLYSEEDKREKELSEKYKEVLVWRGPLYHGLISKFGEFEMRVHSNDHGKHFHVIHKGNGINARFSFPELKVESYTKESRTTIGSKQEAKIREFCKRPDIFKIIENEFTRRG